MSEKVYKCEIEFAKRMIFLCIEDTITAEESNILEKEGFKLLNNGTSLDTDPTVKALYFVKHLGNNK